MSTFTYARGPAQKAPRPLSPVAHASRRDLEDLIWFLHSMKDEIADGGADEAVLVELARSMVRGDGGTALIVRGDKIIEASLGLIIEKPLLRHAKSLRVAWNCVLPECRVTGHAKSLIARAKEIADSLRRPLLLEEFSPDPESGKVKLAKRHLKPMGQLFVHVPEVV